MTFIFDQYKADSMFPNIARLSDMKSNVSHGPYDFALDLYLKRCTTPLQTSEYPDGFLRDLLHRMRRRDAAGKSISDPLRLSDYHVSTSLHDETCSCKDSAAGEEFLIR
jgi:hypothetical protein